MLETTIHARGPKIDPGGRAGPTIHTQCGVRDDVMVFMLPAVAVQALGELEDDVGLYICEDYACDDCVAVLHGD